MFKELKVIKLIVFGGLLFIIISKIDFSENIITDLYTNQLSYYSDETIKIYTSTISLFSAKKDLGLNSVSGKKIALISVPLDRQSIGSNPLKNGMNFKKFVDYKISDQIKPGFYLIGDEYPLVIKSRTKSEITIVYPFANNILYQMYNGKSAFSSHIKKTSLNRTAPVDIYTKGLRPFFNLLNTNYKVNYISDLDLEEVDNYKESELLILYGKLTCWTPRMKKSVESYISNGGNVLLMSSYALNSVCWYSPDDNSLKLVSDTSDAMQSWLGYGGNVSKNTLGISYSSGGYSNDSSYHLVNDGHPILNNLKGDKIQLNAELYSSPPINWYDDLPRIDLKKLNFYKGDIIAYGTASYKENKGIKGIVVLQPDSTSGKIISLGTEDWCLKENYQENESIQLITKNAIDYLLE